MPVYDFMPECHKDGDFNTAIYANNGEAAFIHKCLLCPKVLSTFLFA